ncbi:hypothetical protein AB0N17_20135 [Streptomyces sp. NPDC051133]|uniref:hypothetical protein n=1 Tax=Streptomyces sp. NPDC051133 TaxID=3155521 RepID=UPI003437A7E3
MTGDRLPERQHTITTPVLGQPLVGNVVPAAEQQLAPAPPPGMRVIGYVRIDDVLYPQYGPLYEPAVPAPQPAAPVLDPQAQRTAARGVFAAGTGVGAYFALKAFALVAESLVQLVIAAAVCGLVWVLPTGRRAVREGPTYITNNRGPFAGWWSRTGPRR